MAQGVTLTRGSFSKEFAERLTGYYRSSDPGGRYVEGRLHQWKSNGGLLFFEARTEGRQRGTLVLKHLMRNQGYGNAVFYATVAFARPTWNTFKGL